jgi:hypothetical protein
MDACDPDADIENLRQLIKINTGVDVKLTKKEICQAYEDIQGGKLPLPPLVMNSTRTYLVDKKSPLKPNDYELLFDSSTKRADLKRVARKVNLKNVDQMTKSQIVDAIGKRLRYMKVHEPVKFARRTRVAVNRTTAVNEINNTAVNTVNNTTQTNNLNVNRANNLNTNRVNNTNRANNLNTNRVNNTNRANNLNTNRANNLNTNRVNTNRVNINSPRASFGARPNGQKGMNFSGKSVFRQGKKPAFLGGNRRAVREPVREPVRNNRPTNMNQRPVTMNNTPKKPGFFGSIFGKKNYIAANKFKGEKKGYAFKQGNEGLGYYKNTGGPEPTVGPPQGPTLPNKPIPANDLTTEQAVAKIKQLGLRREKKFLEKMELGTTSKKQVVTEAQQALEEEKRFLAFLDGLKLLNIESEYIKQRMAVDDLRQLRVEAQIKADERSNVKRSNEEKMAMFLESTTLNKADKNTFLNRARQNGANVNKLIMEIKKLISQEVDKVINKKRQEFKTLLKNYNKLSDKDKEDLVKGIDEKTNTNSMKKMAENLIKKRIEEKKNLVAQNLLSFLTPLKINQTNKNKFVKRFKNDDVNVNTLKREALNLEKSQLSGNVENLRAKLDTRLGEIGLNQVNQNAIMKKFRNGNRNVEKLLLEAKQLKALRNAETGNRAKQEYISYLGTLSNLTNEDKKTLLGSGNLNRNKALTLSKQRGVEKKEREKKEFVGFLADLGLTNDNRTIMINKYNANTLNVEALKKQAIGLRSGKISEKKAKLLSHMNTLNLGNQNKQKLLNRIENTNLNTLKANANGIAKKIAGEKAAKERRELEDYINGLGLNINNRSGILNKNPSLFEGKRMANAKLKEKQVKNKALQNRKELEEYINSLGLNVNTRVSILNQNPTLVAGKQMANSKLKEKQTKNKQVRNLNELENYINELGLNVNTKRSIMNQNISINQKRKLADVKLQEKQGKNKKNQNRKQLENYINELGLNVNDKVNILNKDPSLNEGRKLANAKLQMKIKEKRNKNRFALSVHLNKLGLTNIEKSKFLEKFNSNVNANTVKANANAFIQNKKSQQRMTKRQELQDYLSDMGLTNQEQLQLLNKFNRNVDNSNAIKKEANTYVRQKSRQQRVTMRDDLFKFLKGLNISQKNAQNLLKEYNNTNVNAQILKNRASGIVETRKQERFVQEEGEFMNYLNTLGNLTAKNKSDITEKLDSYFTNWNSLKKSATNLALQRAKERRDKERNELSAYANNLGLNSDKKRSLVKALNDKAANLGTLKREANALKKDINNTNRAEKRKKLLRSLVNLDITNQNRESFMEKFGNNTSTANAILQEAKQLETDRIQNRRNQLALFMTNLGLEQNDKNLVLKNFDVNPRNNVRLRKRAEQLKSKRNTEDREKIRRELREYLNTLNMLNNSNKKRLMANNSRSYNNVKNEANQLQVNKKAQSERKKERQDMIKYLNTLNKLTNKNKQKLLSNNTRNTNNVRNEANQLQEIRRVESERKKEFEELSRYINSLNMLNKTNKQKLLANVSRNINSIRNEANQLQSNKKAQLERKKEREELSKYINTLNLLTKEDKQKLLENVTRTYNNVRNEANKLQEFKKTAKRGAELNTLKKSMNGLNQNSQLYVIDKFETQNVTLKSMLKEVAELKKKMAAEKRAQNRSELVDYMNTLDIGNTDKKKILKNYDSQKANFGTLKNRATQINATIKNKAQQRQELSNYINGLGVNGAQLLKKFNDGRSTLNRLKADADKMKTVANARLVNTKKDQLRVHMKNTRLNDKNKKSFINRVAVDTNMNSLKGEVNDLNTQLKTRDEKLAAKKSNVSVFLNTLNDLRPENRKAFLAKVVNANTNTEAIKRDATTMNKAIKNRKVEKERREEDEKKKELIRVREVDKKRLNQHLKGLKHLTSFEKMNYISSFERNGAKIENVIATSKAKDKDNEKDKDTLRFYIRDAKIPQLKKDAYLRQLLQPGINIAPIKRMVNVNKERERITGERIKAQVTKKLQTLKAITANNRAKFLNNLKTKPPNEVLAAAEKLDSERRGVRDKGIKNVAGELSKLTNLERNNRKKLMNRLATNGPEKVLANARALSKERKYNKLKPMLIAKAEKGGLGHFRKNIEAIKTDEDVKRVDEMMKKELEERQKAFKAKKSGEKEMKNVSSKLQGLTSLTRDNRKNLMKRLSTNGAQKVLANAKKLNQDKKNTEKKTRDGVEFKLKKIGVKGSNLQTLMKRWNNNKNQTIFDDARKKVEEDREKAMAKQPLVNRVLREIPGTFGLFRREWESAIKKADKPEELQRLGRLLDQKVKLRQEIEKAPIADDKRRGQLRFVMKMSNDVEKRKQELARNIKAKRGEGDKVKADTAKKLQSMNRLERTNRQGFMNRIAKGEDTRAVLRNADKLQRNRTAKQRLEAERKQKEQKQAQERKVMEQKKREEKMKAGKAKGDLAKSLSSLKDLNRANRTEFITRLNRGNTANAILRNARKRSAEKGLAASKPTTSTAFIDNSKFKTTNNPLFRKAGKQVVQNIRMKTMTNAVKKAAETEKKQQELSKLEGPARVAASRNLGSKQGRDRGQTAEGVKNIFSDQKKKNREEAQRRSVSVKRAQRNRQMREKEERAKARAIAEAKSLKEKEERARAEAKSLKEKEARARAEAKSLKEKVARNKVEAARAETERRRIAMLESQKKKDAKAALRKQNKKLAKATGQGVKATQKKQQAARRRK